MNSQGRKSFRLSRRRCVYSGSRSFIRPWRRRGWVTPTPCMHCGLQYLTWEFPGL